MEIIIIRHAEPDYATDTLTDRGIKEAELLTERLMTKNISHVYCSTLGRARLTAKPFLEASGLDCSYHEWLQEIPLPINQRLTVPDLTDRACPWASDARFFMEDRDRLSGKDWGQNPAYSHEDLAGYSKTVKTSFDELLEKHGLRKKGLLYEPLAGPDFFKDEAWEKTKIAIFCHMGLGTLLLSHMFDVAPPVFWQTLKFMPASISIVRFDNRSPNHAEANIFTIGDTGHLLPLGLTYHG